MDINKSKELLARQLEAAGKLDGTNESSPEFQKWKRDTEIAIEKIFGESSRHLPDLRKISFSPSVYYSGMPADASETRCRAGLIEARQILQSMIEEISEYGLDVPGAATKMTHQIFIASSQEAKTQAKTLIRDLANPNINFRPWWETARPGRMFLSELAQVAIEVSAALFVFTPDISGTFRRKRVRLPNQNVLFELGYFFTVVKPERIAIIKYGETMIPSDLLGYTHITGSRFFKARAAAVPGKATKSDFLKWVSAL